MFRFFLYVITALAAVLVTFYLYLTWNFNYWRKRGITTAEPLTLFGSIPNIVKCKRNFILDIHDLYVKYKRHNRAVGIFITRKPALLLLHPKLVHDILVTNFTQFHDTLTSLSVDDRKEDTLVSRNPFWCAGDEWKQRRSEAVPGLTRNRLKQSFAIWESSCTKLTKFLERKLSTNTEVIETKDLAYRYTADVMCDFIWGIDSGSLNEIDTILLVTKKWTNHTFEMLSSFLFFTIIPVWRKIRPTRFFPKDTDEFFVKLQKDAIEMRRKKTNAERPDFLNHLLQLNERKQFSLDDFTGHSLTVMLDGFETAAVVLMHLLYYLALYPEVQEKLRTEIKAALLQENGLISYEILITLPYLDQCVYEALRMVSAIPAFLRLCTKPTSLEFTKGQFVEVQAGQVVIIPSYSIHYDERYYPEPLKFNPDRFDNNTHLELTKQGIFLPFSDGPRICMGMNVGLLSTKSAVVAILKNYEISKCALTPINGTTKSTTFVMTLDGDIMLKYKKLNL